MGFINRVDMWGSGLRAASRVATPVLLGSSVCQAPARPTESVWG